MTEAVYQVSPGLPLTWGHDLPPGSIFQKLPAVIRAKTGEFFE